MSNATTSPRPLLQRLARTSLVTQIVIGLIAGILLALISPQAGQSVGFVGNLFVAALKAVAPPLVFLLVTSAIASHKRGQQTHIRPVLVLYLISTLAAALVGVSASFLFP